MNEKIEATVLKDRVLLKTIPMVPRDLLDTTTKGQEDPNIFEVLAVGPKVEDVEHIVQGALIVKHQSSGVEFYDNGKKLIVIREDDILLVLNKPNE